LVFILNFERLM